MRRSGKYLQQLVYKELHSHSAPPVHVNEGIHHPVQLCDSLTIMELCGAEE